MRKILSLIAVAALSTACSTVTPNAGEEAVLVSHPIIFGSGGVYKEPVKTGLTYVAPTTSAIIVNMQPRQQQFTFDDLFTADGVPLDFHAALQYQITDSVKLVEKFGADDGPNGMGFFLRVLDQPIRQAARDAVKKHGLNEMAINPTAAVAVDEEVTKSVIALIDSTGVPIKLLGLSLGRANPPDAIKHQRIATAEQEQRVNTEKQRKLAEDVRKAAEESRALADRAYNDKMGLDSGQYIQLKQLETLQSVCAKGNCNFVTGGANVLVPIKQ